MADYLRRPIADSIPLELAVYGSGSGHWDRVNDAVTYPDLPDSSNGIRNEVYVSKGDRFVLADGPSAIIAVRGYVFVEAGPDSFSLRLTVASDDLPDVKFTVYHVYLGSHAAAWFSPSLSVPPETPSIPGTNLKVLLEVVTNVAPLDIPAVYVVLSDSTTTTTTSTTSSTTTSTTTTTTTVALGSLAAILDPHTRLTKLLAQQGGLRGLRGVAKTKVADLTSYLVQAGTSLVPVGLTPPAGKLLAYYRDGADNKILPSSMDGKAWNGGDVATISAWATYAALDVRFGDDGRTQHAVLYKSPNLCYSRNTKGDGTTWSAPVVVANVGTTQPAACVLAEPHAALRVYYQVGTATPVTLACSRIDGGGTWA